MSADPQKQAMDRLEIRLAGSGGQGRRLRIFAKENLARKVKR